jgi:hypothetical protein
MTNFADALNRKADEIERPKPLPVGTYLVTIPAQPEMKKIGQKETPAAEYTVRVVSAGPDVDQEALNAAGGCQGKTLRLTYYLTDESVYRFRDFLTDTLDIDPAGRTLGEMIPDSVNRMFNATIKHKPSQDGTQIYTEISSTARA